MGLNKINKFIIDKKLPSLNEVIAANRTNIYVGAKLKKSNEQYIKLCIRKAIIGKALHKVDKPAIIHFTWHERTKKRDADNIASSKKFILDAMVSSEILIDDSRKYVKGFTDTIVDDTTDYVEVEIEGLEN